MVSPRWNAGGLSAEEGRCFFNARFQVQRGACVCLPTHTIPYTSHIHLSVPMSLPTALATHRPQNALSSLFITYPPAVYASACFSGKDTIATAEYRRLVREQYGRLPDEAPSPSTVRLWISAARQLSDAALRYLDECTAEVQTEMRYVAHEGSDVNARLYHLDWKTFAPYAVDSATPWWKRCLSGCMRRPDEANRPSNMDVAFLGAQFDKLAAHGEVGARVVWMLATLRVQQHPLVRHISLGFCVTDRGHNSGFCGQIPAHFGE